MFDEPYTNIIHICLWLDAINVNGSSFFPIAFQFIVWTLFSMTKLHIFSCIWIYPNENWIFERFFLKDFLFFYVRFDFSFITRKKMMKSVPDYDEILRMT